MIKKIEVPFLSHLQRSSPVLQISATLDSMIRHRISYAPWPDFNYVPEASFSIAHGNNCIFLKYYVAEDVVRATWYKPNDPVYKDSCVEFFIDFDDSKEYYNLEFNVTGTCKLNYGTERDNRKLISEQLIAAIKYLATIQNKTGADGKPRVEWELTLMIPLNVFSENKLASLSGRKCYGNFYKCGDDLPMPHFLAWNNIQSAEPNFHVPECFGEIIFQ
jgi:hypothetical protein